MLILDAGAFIAVERGDREVLALIKADRAAGNSPRSHGGVVAEVWRGGAGRQTMLARLLPGVDINPVDDRLGRAAGMLLAQSGTSDAIDACVITMTGDGDTVLTSDTGDLIALAAAAGTHVELIAV